MFRKMILVFVLLIILSGCLSFGGGSSELMLERGQGICENTNGEWVDNRCIYPAWPINPPADTTTAVLGVEA